MSFPAMNAQVVSTEVFDMTGPTAEGAHPFLATASQYPLLCVPGVVDVTGIEFHLALVRTAATVIGQQTLGSADNTLRFAFGDTGTTATGTASGNHLYHAATTESDLGGLSNARTGGFDSHEGAKAAGTSTTDLDADDWVTLHIVANATQVAGAVQTGMSFVYGKPGAIN